eukprot:CAMPEP_0174258166 /NCGR_PEP_ID=MMETSP0439-20130205/7217_1 /TAXON_ID=0 /ORGANISM="Stereomyxa ramosa, Strain Chinc5" /LENGTH=551 /DNA_ID=CAMNT_0015341577 /DNA_START=58 /DNA_END=1709 /DNA_ORIENTATION=-
MNLIHALQDYILKLVESVSGMKVLLLDKETSTIVGLVFSQSQLLQKEVYLFERLDIKERERMAHLKALVYVRPTNENVALLQEEFKNPKYGEYHLVFTHCVGESMLKVLGESDDKGVVRTVQEFFGDYYAINPGMFSLRIGTYRIPQTTRAAFKRTCEGLTSVLLALRVCPVVRYEKSSEFAHMVAEDVVYFMKEEAELFKWRREQSAPVLLIVDRSTDPITPLLHQWTYQAMVHELLGIKNNRVDMRGVPGIRKEMQEIVLSTETDTFYRENIFSNFGDLGINLKKLVDEFQARTKSNTNIQSLDDMKNFLDEYPEFQKLSGNVTKHVSLMGELSRLVDFRALLDVSEVEQELACQRDHSDHFKKITQILEDQRISKEDCFKLVLLYVLRYSDGSNQKALNFLKEKLSECGVDQDSLTLINSLHGSARAKEQMQGNLFESSTFLKIASRSIRGLKGVSNIYTQHDPILKSTVENLIAGKLKESDYPFVSAKSDTCPTKIVVFMVGGATYEEACALDKISKQSNVSIILGGSTIHNSKSFIRELWNVNYRG